MKEVYIVSAVRTPIGSFGGVLSSLSATQLGSTAIKGALEKAGVQPSEVNEVFMGNVIASNLGQAPAKQAALGAGIGHDVPCTTVNKVCASGMKTLMLGAQSIMLGDNDIVVTGGMESMSNIPYYVPKGRYGHGYGHGQLLDGLVKDGLSDAYNGEAMGVCADATAVKCEISREEQDAFAIESYKRTAMSTEDGIFVNEIIPVAVPQRRGDDVIVDKDEEFTKVKFEKIPSLRAVFTKDGTVTAANASTINDGAASIILASEEAVKRLGLKPIAKVVSFADASLAPEWFTIAPPDAANKALKKAGLSKEDIDYWEVNEAFSVVTLAFSKQLGLSSDIVNVHGGSVSMGHPLGASGARIMVTLMGVLNARKGKKGLAAICNGGGGASAVIIEKL
ncbi:acetyl-CoA C-acyltransferase [Flammeovirga yaeyamensis]|uniref:acetyl-CoA C-acetyltransferase n=1 Tax=Flammeovirga yaeyamensis TaxID=367791 RepID=A0AAX1N7P0_9BACT|nr:acetyl-CoA C-acyltransferase [Flammeovirga yaeyamensis]MBB3699024.1 acetyl-CoA C-acetyltransferase [Flammeovirga yaeyamensis]NMF36458.1 acetyl-CoA C-acyltransferase [Flammeovirga yaeyamensis]QWG03584.1 acetyl-CoA C-acyltransferase [Flammeovirga yaeyamensis]